MSVADRLVLWLQILAVLVGLATLGGIAARVL